MDHKKSIKRWVYLVKAIIRQLSGIYLELLSVFIPEILLQKVELKHGDEIHLVFKKAEPALSKLMCSFVFIWKYGSVV